MDPTENPNRGLAAWPALLLFIGSGLIAVRLPLVDDAYISLRYAWNLANGRGLVFNPGEVVEGYSNFLWTMLSAGTLAAGLDAIDFVRVAGLAFSLATAALVVYLLRREHPARAALAVLWLCGSMVFIRASTNGLETALFTGLIALGFAEDRAARPFTAALVFAFSALVRFEGAGVFAVWWIVRSIAGRKDESARPLAALAVFAAVFVPYFVWRWVHFGSLVPNTFLLRTGAPVAALRQGLVYVATFAAVAPVVALPLLTWRRWGDPMRWALAAYLVYTAAVGGDSLDSYRFVAPVLPLGIVLTAEWLGRIRRRGPAIAAAAVLTLWMGALSALHFVNIAAVQIPGERQFVLTAEAVSRIASPGDKVAASAIGQLGYANPDVVVIDLLGVTDPAIARAAADPRVGAAAHRKFDPRRVLAREPDYFFPLGSGRPGDLPGAYAFTGPLFETALVDLPAFRERYELRRIEIEPGFGIGYFARRGSAR